MSDPQASMIASSIRPIRLRMRADLRPEQQNYQGRDCWVIKDPVSLKYYRFEHEEFQILRMLDGNSSAEEIKHRFEAEFSPQRLSFSELYQFVGMLHRSALLVSDSAGQGIELFRRGQSNRSRQRRQSLTNMLSFRLRGFDPDRILSFLDSRLGWFFSLWSFTLALMLGLGALGLLFSNFEIFQNKLPTFRDFFAGRNWLSLAIVLGVTKVLHEFGHGLACKRFGGQCHEMGVMFLVFTPCLYCNVSDSWMLPNKWHRIFISAAGMYVELILASAATFVWWFSHPGIVNQLSLNVMFVCSVTTLMFNANPLMKYDGYYILSDWLEIPNLRQKSSALLSSAMSHWLLGLPGRVDPFLPTGHRWLFVIYSLAAPIYRWIITFSIFWFLYRLLEPYGVQIIGQLLAVIAILGLVIMPTRQLFRFFSVPGRWSAVNRTRFSTCLCALGAVFMIVLFFPLPHEIRCSFYLQPAVARNVYVEQGGIVMALHTEPGQIVKAGQPIVTLASAELARQLTSTAGELLAAEATYLVTQSGASLDDQIARELPTALAAFQTASNKLAERQRDFERLIVRAPSDGILMAAPPRQKADSNADHLNRWHGSPLDSRNLGAFLEPQTIIGKVSVDQTKMQAVLAVDQADIEFVTAHQPVKLWVRQVPGAVFHSNTGSVSSEQMSDIPKSLSTRFGGDIVATADASGRERPQSTTFQVSADLNVANQSLLSGATGIAKIRVGSQTLAQRLWRAFMKTFRFEL